MGRVAPRRVRAMKAAALVAACAALVLAPGARAGTQRSRGASGASSLELAYAFLDRMMDRYASGPQLRLVQSFSGGTLERRHFTDSVTYDDALIIDALLARGSAEDLERAKLLGEALLYVQANDPAHDGRVRAAYAPALLTSPAAVQATDATSDVGNMAWVGQALVQLYARTGIGAYLSGARAIGEWIYANAYDTRGSGGYTGGQEAGGSRITWKSTEHNVDVFSFFTLLAAQSKEAVWSSRAQWARGFVVSMYSAGEGMFYVGTGEDGVSVNASVFVEDVNSWSYLALRDPEYAPSLNWEETHLSASRRGFSGVSFCTGDRRGVWFEGTAHLADALVLRGGPGDAAQAAAYLADIAHAQARGPHTDGMGIIAASKNGLSTCEGERYFASLHTGATAWYLLALQAADPFLALP
ncbi:MAG TPA: hypothetical protein VNZ05_07745 [Solirubrobacteraceae bacterium]|nr:hypothetical protein [Solirubrobacteraceae bacterium]